MASFEIGEILMRSWWRDLEVFVWKFYLGRSQPNSDFIS